jgi:hypothetical protein
MADGEHPPLEEACEEPTTWKAIQRRRELRVQAASEEGKAEPRPTELDVWPLIVKNNIRNSADNAEAYLRLAQVARQSCSAAMVAFLFKIRRQLPALIDDVWVWEEIDGHVAKSQETRMDALLRAVGEPCVCEGLWPTFVQDSLKVNGIDASSLAHDLYRSLQNGRCESVPIVVLAGFQGGEGKSLLLAPLGALLGDDYLQEGLATGQFPMFGLENKKAVILNEWAFSNAILPLSTQLLWFEGKPVPITRPQNNSAVFGHHKYKGSAPIFITSPMKKLEPLMQEAEAAVHAGLTSELTMLMRRLRVYKFTRKAAPPAKQLLPCACCFSQFLLEGEAHWCQRST